jgi:hypothetical protein
MVQSFGLSEGVWAEARENSIQIAASIRVDGTATDIRVGIRRHISDIVRSDAGRESRENFHILQELPQGDISEIDAIALRIPYRRGCLTVATSSDSTACKIKSVGYHE